MTCLHIRMINPYHPKCQLLCNIFRSFLVVPSNYASDTHLTHLRMRRCTCDPRSSRSSFSSCPVDAHDASWDFYGSGLFRIQVIHPNSSTPPFWVKPKMKKFTGQGAVDWGFFFFDVRDPHIVMKSLHIRLSRPRKVAASWRKKRSPQLRPSPSLNQRAKL